ncbi:hypothetical protein [Pedobacter gandavensis]|uniref:Uncharacterized protein n=1 Tax=Pedobacter gandavensis TaxID=2679963 RepID=A0ABR6EUK3_9SPHI|nr:hypothetical protein [Pedobacter gandavensis]MBB2148937.1 hypothetical protein [Pedobacter gandavensis]
MKEKDQTPRNLSHHERQPSSFNKVMPIVKEAKLQNMWLYNKLNGNWYTPDEFQTKYQNNEYNNFDVSRILENMVIRNPIAGVNAFHKQLNKELEDLSTATKILRERGEAFEKKVIEYYQGNGAK